jgi:hypothetical protein
VRTIRNTQIQSYLTGNTLRHRYKYQPVNVIQGNSRCLLREPYGTHRCTVVVSYSAMWHRAFWSRKNLLPTSSVLEHRGSTFPRNGGTPVTNTHGVTSTNTLTDVKTSELKHTLRTPLFICGRFLWLPLRPTQILSDDPRRVRNVVAGANWRRQAEKRDTSWRSDAQREQTEVKNYSMIYLCGNLTTPAL